MRSTAPVLPRLRALCLSFPETSETSSWGHPNFRAGKRVFVAFERVKGQPSIAFRLDAATIDRLLRRKDFFVTPYGRGQWVSLRVDRALDWKLVADLVGRSYRIVAPKTKSRRAEQTRYVTFLRAINVAGHATVKMDALKAAFVSAGCKCVETVIQSGNVIFESTDRDGAALSKRIQKRLCDLLGGPPGIVTRTLSELERMADAAPFKDSLATADPKLYVVFLEQKPAKRPVFPLVSSQEALEAIGMSDREVFIVSRRRKNGFFGFPNNFIEKELGVTATTRNWSTVTKIIQLFGASESANSGKASDRRPPDRRSSD